jgi:hypothetical protein
MPRGRVRGRSGPTPADAGVLEQRSRPRNSTRPDELTRGLSATAAGRGRAGGPAVVVRIGRGRGGGGRRARQQRVRARLLLLPPRRQRVPRAGGRSPGHEVEEVGNRSGARPRRGPRWLRRAVRGLAGVNRGGRRGRRGVPGDERPAEVDFSALQTLGVRRVPVLAAAAWFGLLGHEEEKVAPPPPGAPRGARGPRLRCGLDLQARRRGAGRRQRLRRREQRDELSAAEQLVGCRERGRRGGHAELELVGLQITGRRRGRRGVRVEREGVRRGHRCGSHC